MALKDLNPKERKFVEILYESGEDKTLADAYLEAGYNADKESGSAASAASQKKSQPKIQEALDQLKEGTKEEGKSMITNSIKDAVQTLRNVMNGDIDDPQDARVRKESALALLNRAGLIEEEPDQNKGDINLNFDISPEEEQEILEDLENMENG